MLNELISVIVPVYKVEKYLEKCLNSIRNQTYKNIEIILVNDGSPDKCPKMCDDIAAEDERIIVIHKQNGGQSSARNDGLSVAKGIYIAFIDSDDYIEADYIEKLYFVLKQQDADVSVCSFGYEDETYKELSQEMVSEKIECLTGRDILLRVLTPQGYRFIVVWNKLYRRELFQKLTFLEGKIYEDEEINHKIFWNCKKVVLLPQLLYHYVKREGSTMAAAMTADAILMQREFHIKRLEFYKKEADMELYLKERQLYCNWMVNMFIKGNIRHDRELKKLLQKEMRTYASAASNVASLFVKLQNYVGYIHLPAAAALKKIYKGKKEDA